MSGWPPFSISYETQCILLALKGFYGKIKKCKPHLNKALVVGGPLQLVGVDDAVLQPRLVVVGVRLHAHAERVRLETRPDHRQSYQREALQ